ncbi:MAG: hypothetical protein QNJ38_08040 [Prochloraceae cyanobacterium]|nr:hypothetical protein [Prochloraceae cyanobacterium]
MKLFGYQIASIAVLILISPIATATEPFPGQKVDRAESTIVQANEDAYLQAGRNKLMRGDY